MWLTIKGSNWKDMPPRNAGSRMNSWNNNGGWNDQPDPNNLWGIEKPDPNRWGDSQWAGGPRGRAPAVARSSPAWEDQVQVRVFLNCFIDRKWEIDWVELCRILLDGDRRVPKRATIRTILEALNSLRFSWQWVSRWTMLNMPWGTIFFTDTFQFSLQYLELLNTYFLS